MVKYANLGTNMRNFVIKSKFLTDYFCFLPKFFCFWHSTAPKNGLKKRISENVQDPIGQAKFANSQILDKGKRDLIATSHVDRHVVEQGHQR